MAKKSIKITDRKTYAYLLTVLCKDGSVKKLVRTTQKHMTSQDVDKDYIKPRKSEKGAQKFVEMIDILETDSYVITDLAWFEANTPVKSIEDFCTDMISIHDSYRNGYNDQVFYQSGSLYKYAKNFED